MEAKELTNLGLTNGESKAYLAMLKIGSSTVGPIVKESKIAYSNIYEVLERLIKKGLASFIIKQKTKYFQATPPNRLEEYLKNKEKEIKKQKDKLKQIIPSLIALTSSKENKTDAEIFIGTKGLKTAYEKIILNATKEDEGLFFYIHEEEYAEKSDRFYNEISELSKTIKTKGLANKEYKKSWFMKKAKFLKMKYVDFPLPGNIDIVRNSVMITSWHPEIVGILIHSESIARHFRDYFNKVWEIAK
ncbi:MAG: helix-turn-helix domain-containing protein [archaeon]